MAEKSTSGLESILSKEIKDVRRNLGIMKFDKQAHKIVVELTIISLEPPDDAGFGMTKSGDGEFVSMRVVRKDQLTIDAAAHEIKSLGGDPGVLKGD